MISTGPLRQYLPRKPLLLSIFCVLLLLGYYGHSHRHAIPTFNRKRPESIPRIVHLVQLKPHEDAQLHFSFQAFLCVYTAYHFIQPSAIYIHTDHSQAAVDSAAANGTVWTRKVLTAFPRAVLRVNHVEPPTHAGADGQGLALERVEHRSDFVRMAQVALRGGVYLDWDVLTLRSPAPLLSAGFAAVVGRQADGNINNGCFLARRGAALVRLMNDEMPAVFSGEWQRHSTGLITPLAERIAGAPGEVLILDAKAFAPTSWLDDSASALFSEQEGEGDGPHGVNVDTKMDALERWSSRAPEGQETNKLRVHSAAWCHSREPRAGAV